MEEVVHTTIMAPRMVMGMEEETDRTAPTHLPQPKHFKMTYIDDDTDFSKSLEEREEEEK